MTELAAIRARVDAAARRAGRDPGDVRIVAVSKTFPARSIATVAAEGHTAFGENRIQEAQKKIPEANGLVPHSLEWHFIGPLQRNKARRAVELFDVIHSVDRPELVAELARAAVAQGRRPRVLVQVNVDREDQKSGVEPDALDALVADVDAAEALELVGLMAIPRACADPEQVRPSFARLRELRDGLNARRPGPALRELSMGMTADFEVAVEEGATWVRIGTAIFGRRTG